MRFSQNREVVVDKTYRTDRALVRQQNTRVSYQAALNKYKTRSGLARISWASWLIVIITVMLWCFTAYQTALAGGAHSWQDILRDIANNAINVQDKDNDVLSTVLTTYGAKENSLILHGEYWRFITPIFLHANALHVGLNMLNFCVLGVFLERLVGHLRFLLIYLVAGVISVVASFFFAPQEVSVGASGAIFGLVSAYSVFVLVHRRAFPYGGLPAISWLIIVIGVNLSIGFFIQNVDNYAHIGGLVSGCILGWWFTPRYMTSSTQKLVDMNGLTRRWPLALLTILGTLVVVFIALRFARA